MPGSPQPDKLLLRSMRTDCFWSLCPLSPCSTSTFYCGRWLMGQLHSRRSRHMQPTFWAVTYGMEVSDTLKESVKKYLRPFVGTECVFPTQNDAPRIMTEFLNKPYRFELRDEYTKGPNPRPLPTIKASYYHGKPATQKVLEHFCRSTPVVSSCDNPRCLSRLVIVPKQDPGAPKTLEPTSYRVTMNALINACLKPTPSTHHPHPSPRPSTPISLCRV